MFIAMDHIWFTYTNTDNYIIKDFSLSIPEGSITAILGESGSGKSTLLRLLCGFEIPVRGSMSIDNTIIVDHKRYIPTEKRGVGLVFQDYALFPHLTVTKNIEFGIKKATNKEKSRKVHEMLELVQMSNFKARYPHELSGGQQQRIALARALATEPKVLLLDEPFSNLDAHLQHTIRTELKGILEKKGITTLFVSHDKDDALAIADHIVVLKDGVKVREGAPHEVLDDLSTEYIAELFDHKN